MHHQKRSAAPIHLEPILTHPPIWHVCACTHYYGVQGIIIKPSICVQVNEQQRMRKVSKGASAASREAVSTEVAEDDWEDEDAGVD